MNQGSNQETSHALPRDRFVAAGFHDERVACYLTFLPAGFLGSGSSGGLAHVVAGGQPLAQPSPGRGLREPERGPSKDDREVFNSRSAGAVGILPIARLKPGSRTRTRRQ